jgi:hypothetical protein
MCREKEEEREETQEQVRDRETETERDVREVGRHCENEGGVFFWVVAVSLAARKRDWERHEEGNGN